MFLERNIIYFDPFFFKNGNTAKPKYFVILKNIEHQTILASLPTRKDSIPTNNTDQKGCVELPEINLNCFVISEMEIVTECGKMFDFKTHLYGHQLDDYTITLMKEIYPIEGTDYFIWGRMKSELFDELIACFKSSKAVKQKYRRLL